MLAIVSLASIAIIAIALVLGLTKRFLAVGGLAMANVLVFALTALGPRQDVPFRGRSYSSPVIHQELGLSAERLYAGEPLAYLQIVTSMFVHFDIMHLIGNLFILLAFALVLEDLIGPRRIIAIYLVTGVVAALSQVVVNFGQPMLLMGASGAVAGITGAFAGAYPNMVMRLPIPAPIIFFARMRVITWAIMFALIQIAMQTISTYGQVLGNVAYAAHLGGLVGGLMLGYFWLKKATQPAAAPVKVDLDDLQRFATDASTRRAYDEMQANRDEPEVFKAWFERFWEGARDPDSELRVVPGPKGKLIREDGKEIEIRPSDA